MSENPYGYDPLVDILLFKALPMRKSLMMQLGENVILIKREVCSANQALAF